MEQSEEFGRVYCVTLLGQLDTQRIRTLALAGLHAGLIARIAAAIQAAPNWEAAAALAAQIMAATTQQWVRQGQELTPKEPWRDVERQPAPMPDGLSEAEADALERLATRVEKGEVKR